jgi:hypothetical protein
VELGIAELANEKPRQFRLAPNAPARPGLADGASQPGAEAGSGADPAGPETTPEAEAETEPGPAPETAPATVPEQEPGDDAEPEPATGQEPEADAEITAGAA